MTPLALFVAHGMLRPLPVRVAVARPPAVTLAELVPPTLVPLVDDPLLERPPETPVPLSGAPEAAVGAVEEQPRPDPTPVDPVPEIARAGGVSTAIGLLVTDASAGRRPRLEALRQALDLAMRGDLEADAAELARRLAPDRAIDHALPWITERQVARAGVESARAFLEALVKAGYAADRPLAASRAVIAAAAGESEREVAKALGQDPHYWGRILPCMTLRATECPALDELIREYPGDASLAMFRARVRARAGSLEDLQPILTELRTLVPESLLLALRLEAEVLRREGRAAEATDREQKIQQLVGTRTERSW